MIWLDWMDVHCNWLQRLLQFGDLKSETDSPTLYRRPRFIHICRKGKWSMIDSRNVLRLHSNCGRRKNKRAPLEDFRLGHWFWLMRHPPRINHLYWTEPCFCSPPTDNWSSLVISLENRYFGHPICHCKVYAIVIEKFQVRPRVPRGADRYQ